MAATSNSQQSRLELRWYSNCLADVSCESRPVFSSSSHATRAGSAWQRVSAPHLAWVECDGFLPLKESRVGWFSSHYIVRVVPNTSSQHLFPSNFSPSSSDFRHPFLIQEVFLWHTCPTRRFDPPPLHVCSFRSRAKQSKLTRSLPELREPSEQVLVVPALHELALQVIGARATQRGGPLLPAATSGTVSPSGTGLGRARYGIGTLRPKEGGGSCPLVRRSVHHVDLVAHQSGVRRFVQECVGRGRPGRQVR